jgi:hypothetical protein
MLPLDGGHVMHRVLDAWTKGRGERPARIISIVVASLAALAGLLNMWLWAGLLAGSLVYSNVRALSALSEREKDAPLRRVLDEAYVALRAQDAGRVLAAAGPAVQQARTPETRAEALQLVAFGLLLEGRLVEADQVIQSMPQGFIPHPELEQMRARVIARR